MTILEHPDAQTLLGDATLCPQQIEQLAAQIEPFLVRYHRHFRRTEQRDNARLMLLGKLSSLPRKTCEPIAHHFGVRRENLQDFVGSSPWDDEAVMAQLRREVAHEWSDPQGVLIIDPSSFPKKGTQSCAVARQWCGRLGKVENCQVGIFLCYACRCGHVGLDRRLWLPVEWAEDADLRAETHVPEGVVYRERWQVALDLIDRAKAVPHAWVVADCEFGRASAFRAALRARGERYLLDVLDDTLIRDQEAPVTQPARRRGSARKAPWQRVKAWAESQPASRWQRFHVRAGEKGPLVVEALTVRVHTRQEHRPGPEERLVVTRTVEQEPRIHYRLSNAVEGVGLAELVRIASERHRAEQVFEEGKSEVGLGQYEVRGWPGWHHHMTLSLLALWFLAQRRAAEAEKTPR
jgi:SRSO17 transposase